MFRSATRTTRMTSSSISGWAIGCHRETRTLRPGWRPITSARAWHDQKVRLDIQGATTSADLRAHNLARLLRAVHDGGGARTRAELTRQLSLARGRQPCSCGTWLTATSSRSFRPRPMRPWTAPAAWPTGVPSPHPYGPVALAVDLRDDSFSIASFELTGRGNMLERQERRSASGMDLLNSLRQRLVAHRGALGPRRSGSAWPCRPPSARAAWSSPGCPPGTGWTCQRSWPSVVCRCWPATTRGWPGRGAARWAA